MGKLEQLDEIKERQIIAIEKAALAQLNAYKRGAQAEILDGVTKYNPSGGTIKERVKTYAGKAAELAEKRAELNRLKAIELGRQLEQPGGMPPKGQDDDTVHEQQTIKQKRKQVIQEIRTLSEELHGSRTTFSEVQDLTKPIRLNNIFDIIKFVKKPPIPNELNYQFGKRYFTQPRKTLLKFFRK
jgi:uncharacterized coiled-coil DUF342 family protein